MHSSSLTSHVYLFIYVWQVLTMYTYEISSGRMPVFSLDYQNIIEEHIQNKKCQCWSEIFLVLYPDFMDMKLHSLGI